MKEKLCYILKYIIMNVIIESNHYLKKKKITYYIRKKSKIYNNLYSIKL